MEAVLDQIHVGQHARRQPIATLVTRLRRPGQQVFTVGADAEVAPQSGRPVPQRLHGALSRCFGPLRIRRPAAGAAAALLQQEPHRVHVRRLIPLESQQRQHLHIDTGGDRPALDDNLTKHLDQHVVRRRLVAECGHDVVAAAGQRRHRTVTAVRRRSRLIRWAATVGLEQISDHDRRCQRRSDRVGSVIEHHRHLGNRFTIQDRWPQHAVHPPRRFSGDDVDPFTGGVMITDDDDGGAGLRRAQRHQLIKQDDGQRRRGPRHQR